MTLLRKEQHLTRSQERTMVAVLKIQTLSRTAVFVLKDSIVPKELITDTNIHARRVKYVH